MRDAGLWQRWERDGEAHTTCAIVTTGANEKMLAIHHRQPVTIAPADYALWLGESGHGAAPLKKPAPPEQLDFFRVAPGRQLQPRQGP